MDKPRRLVPARRHLRWQDSQACQACQTSRGSAAKVWVGDQSEDSDTDQV